MADAPTPHYEVQPDPAHKGKFRTVNTAQEAPGGGPVVHGSGQTKIKATEQWRALEAAKHDPGWQPDPDTPSTLKHTPGPGKYPGTGYSEQPAGRHYGNH